MEYIKIVFLLILSFSASCLVAQNSILDDYVQMGMDQNLQLQKEDLTIGQYASKAVGAKGKLLPEVSFNASYLVSSGGRAIGFPVGDLLNPVNSTLNELTFSNSFPTDIQNVEERFSPHNFHDTRLTLRYSIFNRPLNYNYQAKKQLVELKESDRDLSRQLLKKDIKLAYYNYFKICAVSAIVKNTDGFLKELLKYNQKLVKYNKATSDVVISVEYEIEKNKAKLIDIDREKINAKTYFNILLNREFDEEIAEDPQTKIRIKKMIGADTIADLALLQKKAIGSRPELAQIQKSSGLNETMIQLNQKRLLPTIGVELNAGFQGTGYLFNKDQRLISAGLSLNWLLYDGKQRKQDIEQLRLEALKIGKDEQALSQQIRLDVINSYYTVVAVKNKLTAEQAALAKAQKYFTLIQNKFNNQQAILLEYLDAQTKLSNARISVEVVEYDLLIKQAELDRALNL